MTPRDPARSWLCPDWLRWLLPILAIVVAGMAYWQWRILLPAEVPGAISANNRDLYAAYYPVHKFAYQSPGLVPLWNPHQLAGTPFLANANGVLYPVNFFLGLLLPIEKALGYASAFHVIFAGLGALWCGRALGLSFPASLVAAFSFMFSATLLRAIVHPSHLAGYSWIPYIALAGGYLLRHPGLRSALLLGAAVAMQVLTGSSQMVVYCTYALAAGGASYLLAAPRSERPPLVRVLLASALAELAAAALAAVQILPTLELLPFAGRQSLAPEAIQSISAGIGFARAFLLGTGGAYVLAGIALLDRSHRTVAVSLLALFAFAFLVGSGSPLFENVFYHLPLVDRFRAPVRMLVVADFAISILAAVGLDAVVERRLDEHRVASTLLVGTSASLIHVFPGRVSTGANALPALAPLVVAVVAVAAIWLTRRSARGAATALVLATILGARFAAPGNTMMLPQHSPSSFFDPPPFAQFLQRHARGARVLLVHDQKMFFPLMAKAGTLWGFGVVDDYEPLAPRAYWDFRVGFKAGHPTAPDFWASLNPQDREARWRALDLLSTRYVVIQKGAAWPEGWLGRFVRVYEDDLVSIYENLRSLPRAYLVPRAEVIGRRDATLARLRDPAFDPRASVVLDSAPRWASSKELSALASEATLLESRPDEVIVQVTTPRPAVLVLTDLDFPGWEALVNGRPRRIRRANLLFRAIDLEAGSHEVRFRYRPGSAPLGVLVSALAAVIIGVALIVTGRRGRSRRAHRA